MSASLHFATTPTCQTPHAAECSVRVHLTIGGTWRADWLPRYTGVQIVLIDVRRRVRNNIGVES